MSDHGPAQVIIYDCPPDQREAALSEILSLGFGFDWGAEIPDELAIGEMYTDDEAALDAWRTLAEALIRAAPDATFACWNDPKYEYDGELTWYAPDLGEFSATCGPEGEPQFNAAEVRAMIGLPEDERDRKLGLPWAARFKKLRVAESAT